MSRGQLTQQCSAVSYGHQNIMKIVARAWACASNRIADDNKKNKKYSLKLM